MTIKHMESIYPLEHYKVLRELFHDRPGASEVTLEEAASRYEAEEPRADFYVLNEQEREFVAHCAQRFPTRFLDRWIR